MSPDLVVTDLRLCRDCAHGRPDPDDVEHYRNRCYHPRVSSDYPDALANIHAEVWPSVECGRERRREALTAPCGKAGWLWEPKS